MFDWSQTAASNSNSDIGSGIDWREGMLPGQVDDSARAMMAGLAALMSDQGGLATVTGTANDIVLALAQTPKAAAPGLFSFVPVADNTAAMTLKVTTSTTPVAYPLRVVTGVDIEAGGVKAGRRYTASLNPATNEYLLSGQNRTKADFAALISSIATPPGIQGRFYTTTAPSGWLACDGSAVSRTAQAPLFAAIGTLYGPGDGTTTFNLPNAAGKADVGVDPTSSVLPGAATVGSTLGEAAHVLTIAELAAHNHSGATGTESATHTHSYSVPSSTTNVGPSATTPVFLGGGLTSASSGTENASHTHAIPSQGSGTAHNNVQPSMALLVCIKT